MYSKSFSHLARADGSGEQLVELNQLVGCGVKLERYVVQCVPRLHLEDHKTEEKHRISKLLYCAGWSSWVPHEKERNSAVLSSPLRD